MKEKVEITLDPEKTLAATVEREGKFPYIEDGASNTNAHKDHFLRLEELEAEVAALRAEITYVSEADYNLILNTINDPPQPNEKLKKVVKGK